MELATAQPESLWKCTPTWHSKSATIAGHDALHVVGQGPAVGVAQHEGLGPGLLGGAQDAQA